MSIICVYINTVIVFLGELPHHWLLASAYICEDIMIKPCLVWYDYNDGIAYKVFTNRATIVITEKYDNSVIFADRTSLLLKILRF